jgi:two-component system phosphate regulon sensor histidine kinase PhoR
MSLLASPYFRRLFLPYLVLVIAAVAAVGILAAGRLRSSYLASTQLRLRENARLIGDGLAPSFRDGRVADVQATVERLSRVVQTRITVVLHDGKVVAESDPSTRPASMQPHNSRAEILRAAASGEGTDLRHSDTLHRDMFYLALRFETGPTPWYVRVALEVEDIDHQIGQLYGGLAVASLVAVLLAGAVCYWFARRHAAPVTELSGVARAISAGQLNRRVLEPRDDPSELGTLAASLNTVAQSFSSVVTQATRDKAELLAILQSMSEGVIATDRRQRVCLVNSAAGALLNVAVEGAEGRMLCEVMLNEKVLKGAAEVLAGGRGRTFQIGPTAGRYLEVTICRYPAQGEMDGLVILVHDTTQSVRYQDLRKEFVANVSHELRTPLSVIKGYVETLRDGAINDPQKGPQYLATIERHANQLVNLVGDLLALSRLESLPDLPSRSSVDLAATVRRAVELLGPAAKAKRQDLQLSISTSVPPVAGNADYLERAVANLVDNAIKYTPEGGQIRVILTPDNADAVIEVVDNGIGIPADDLPRVFERFYRVDRSRSRDMGGTGLGLSIVKHVAQVHNGSVQVQSTPGAGSTFRLRIPLPALS